MATVLPVQMFEPTQLTGSAATLYTNPGPASTIVINGRVRFSNTDTLTHQVTAYAVPLGGSASASNCFLNAFSIGPNQIVDVDMPVLKVGDFLQAKADTTLTITASAIAATQYTP